MVLPLVPLVWGVVKLTTLAAAAKGTVWGSARFFQHGFDFEATVAQLEGDLKASKEFGAAVRDLPGALARLRISEDFGDVTASAHALKRVLAALPTDTRAGLDRSLGLSTRIDHALVKAVHRSGQAFLLGATAATEKSVTERLYASYLGLLLIGRSGHVLSDEGQTVACTVLTELHRTRGRGYDMEAIRSFATMRNATHLVEWPKLLLTVPEVDALWVHDKPYMVPMWIVKALGSSIVPKTEGTFLEYLTTFFPNPSKQ